MAKRRRNDDGVEEVHDKYNGSRFRGKRKRSFLNRSASTISLPYFAPAVHLPARLPTTAEIENSQDIFTERTGAKVVSVGSCFVVKYGRHVNLEEGRTMKFVEEYAGMPVPRVYALYRERELNFIIMERIEGQTLQDAWATLSDAEKHDVAAEIKRHLRHLRATQGPGGFCSLDNLPLRDTLFSTGHANDLLRCAGPFSSESDLVDAIVRKCRASESLQGKASFYADNLPLVFQDHVPILSHGDLQRKNIMVRAESAQGSTLAFLDWEFAGWYPTFWEFAQTVCGCGLFDDDWYYWIPKFLDPFLREYAWLSILPREIDY